MRIACGESVDLNPLSVHYEHTVFKPRIGLAEYFGQIARLGVCHHFALVHAEIRRELGKLAQVLGVQAAYRTDRREVFEP